MRKYYSTGDGLITGKDYTEYIPASNPQYGLQVADYENTFYRFNEMVDSPVTPNTAIAELIYHVAVNFHTDFTPNISMVDSIFILNHQAAADSTAFHFKLLPTFFIIAIACLWKTGKT
jgi:hypothetical protein